MARCSSATGADKTFLKYETVKILIKTLFALLVLCRSGQAQSFVNLSFENASFQSDSSSGFYPYLVYASNAIPGWTPYAAGVPQTEILSNNISLSGGAVSITGTNWVYPQIEGKYFVC